jgi:hypothetical protein
MCDKCKELDKKIEHYRKVAGALNDRLTIDHLNRMIADMVAPKAALHPEQK